MSPLDSTGKGRPSNLPSPLDMAAMIRAGATVKDISRDFETSRSTVRRHLYKAGYDAKTGGDRDTTQTRSVQLPRNKPYDAREWEDDALCRQTDPEAFYPEKGGSTREAKRVCKQCVVRAECLEWAVDNDERFGIWGGLSERERRKLKKRMRAAA